MAPPDNPICVALDTTDPETAAGLARALAGTVGYVKIGLEFFYAHGRAGYERVAEAGVPIFLDLKLHDIPNTVAGGLRALMSLDPLPAIVNVHASGGPAMLRAARETVAEIDEARRPKLIAVTVLTSLDVVDLTTLGYNLGGEDTPTGHVLTLARLAHDCGLDGVVCSANDLRALRRRVPGPFLTVVPGIRPENAAHGDQKRVATPASALADGADILVIGRPITRADDPAEAARAILDEIGSARSAARE
ncbi:orotidine-5'-phosphate decarboxylase [Kaustia mangrovi]|uniref:Orotidine 5'-phosphate decarboxylase n=1 Tax=Kaustia mangrovi TaxID=2593653 RepID=A0A7S8HBU4_9HYPH|nr:orotidine-5'-phosphate decarboxylase [Kaustia mangrovi]QPC42568.1 orotidine-5'-phosphate decarboxylase [Kaustia mangrovi]